MYPSFNARALGFDLPAAEAIDLAASAGFAGVDLMVRDLCDRGEDPKVLRKRLDAHGLRPGAWPLAIGWRDTSDTEFRRDLDHLARYAEAAAILGLERTGTWVMPDVPELAGQGAEESLKAAFAFHVDRLGAIARQLDRFGIRLGLEVLGVTSIRRADRHPFIHRMGEPRLIDLIAAIEAEGSPIGLLIDLWHLYAAGEDVEILGAEFIERTVWVHVADLPVGAGPDRHLMIDTVRGLPGDHGAIDIRVGLEFLGARGYNGPVTVEPLGKCPSLRTLRVGEAAPRAARALMCQWPGPDEAARISGT